MRLRVLDSGHTLGAKLLFRMIRLFSGHDAVDAVKLVAYRPAFYGDAMKRVTHEAMRGPSAWSVADRELMAAFVSKADRSEFCIRAHSAVAARADGSDARVTAALENLDAAPLAESLRAVLRMLGKLTKEHALEAADVRAVLDAGASPEQVRDALAVCFAFNVTNRLADALAFAIPEREAFEAGAKFLLSHGYR